MFHRHGTHTGESKAQPCRNAGSTLQPTRGTKLSESPCETFQRRDQWQQPANHSGFEPITKSTTTTLAHSLTAATSTKGTGAAAALTGTNASSVKDIACSAAAAAAFGARSHASASGLANTSRLSIAAFRIGIVTRVAAWVSYAILEKQQALGRMDGRH